MQQIIEQVLDTFQLKNYFRSINFMSEVITMANSEIADDKEFLRKEYAQLIPAYMSYHGYLVKILP